MVFAQPAQESRQPKHEIKIKADTEAPAIVKWLRVTVRSEFDTKSNRSTPGREIFNLICTQWPDDNANIANNENSILANYFK